MILQACVGLRIDGIRREIHVGRRALLPGIDQVELRHVTPGDVTTDIVLQSVGQRTAAFPRGRHASAIPLLIHA